ncbi:hypothetical protein [Adhaeribacter arboris]|uniref:hypothetical protein n=1 Tax=Adhaeribacter arboris TaxID=2072846 RepID=UPI002937058D|nr:hypothetical protein [Adhaeribacter arboris]
MSQLITGPGIDWSQITKLHLDEYIGLSELSPARFRKYLKERFIAQVLELKTANLVNGEADPQAECERLGNLIRNNLAEVTLIRIRENRYIAFNGPPADMETDQSYLII